MKHTPGPWTNDAPGHIRAVVGEGGEKNIATLLANYPMTHAEYRANARLIAAAPELLEVVKLFVSALNTNYSSSTMNYEFGAEARRLLKRIEGGD